MADGPIYRGNLYRSTAELDAWHQRKPEETPVEPDLLIIDAHHHLWPDGDHQFDITSLIKHIQGVNVRASVFVECAAAYSGPVDYAADADSAIEPHLAPLAETRYVVDSVRDNPAATRHGLCAAIIGFSNLLVGERSTRRLLEAHIEAGAGRFRGIRQSSCWDPTIGPLAWRAPPPGLLRDARFLSGFRALAALGLGFDAWQFYPQMGDVVALARQFPEVPIVLDHFGGFIGIGEYAKWPAEGFAYWRANIRALAECPNVVVKMGGLGMPISGQNHYLAEIPVDSRVLAKAWKPFIDESVAAFGSGRCMFGGNFPADRQTASYITLWNAYKIATADYSTAERTDLFSRTASRTYGIEIAA